MFWVLKGKKVALTTNNLGKKDLINLKNRHGKGVIRVTNQALAEILNIRATIINVDYDATREIVTFVVESPFILDEVQECEEYRGYGLSKLKPKVTDNDET